MSVRRELLAIVWMACGGDPGRTDPCSDGAREVERTFYVGEGGFATITAAQAAVRELAPRMTADLIVRIAPGDYELDAPLAFDERDSGTGGFKVIYEADGEPGSVRLLGGRRITAWTPHAGPILVAEIAPGWVFHTLYEDGVRAEPARHPNRTDDPAFPMSHAAYLVTAGVAGSSQRVQYNPGELPEPLDLAALQVFIWSLGGQAWFTDTVPVRAIDRAASQLELAQPTRYAIGAGARYFLQGALQLLDAPGEFFLDAAAGKLYYWPRAADVAGAEIVAPVTTSILNIVGASPTAPVHDLQFRGLRFSSTDFTGWYRFGWPGTGDSAEGHAVAGFDRQLELPAHRLGAITMENTERVEVVFSRVDHAGYGGIYLRFANRNACLYGNLIEHVGINGITVQGGYPGEGDVSRGHRIENNLIHHVGELAGHGAGIDISNSGYNEVAHNWIHDSPRYGLLMHAIGEVAGELLYARANAIHHTRIDATCQDSGDTGALYTYGLGEEGAMASPNTFAQITVKGASADPSMRDLPPNGVFADFGSPMLHFTDIRVDVAGTPYRSNTSAESFTNVSWLPGFDPSRLDEIGLRADFPASYLRD